jgi:hypothetical protein
MSDKRNQTKKYDVVVVGGGMSGICAALASSRHGAKTALIQARPVLGGNASSEMRMHITGANCHLGKTDLQETGILMEILLENKRRNPYQTFAIWDSVLWEKVRYQENLDLYLNTSMDEAYTEGSKITSILCHQISTETTYHFYADIFVDATGNGSLGMYAGAEFRMGSEGKAEFNEPNAPDEPNSTTMGNTLMFIAEDMGEPVPFKKPDWAYTFTEEDLIFRGHGNMTISHGENGVQELYNADSGYWWIELGGTSHDIIGDHEIITEELYKCVYGIWDHIKNSGDHGAQNYALTWVGSVPGVRESRRLVGDYLLTENDVAGNRIFEDAVAYGGWPMDEHPPHGLFHKGYPVRYINFPGAYTIPYRCYYSKNIDNLMMAGRNISTTKMALGSTRVMGTCAVGGQAVGTAAAMAIKYGCTPRQIGQHMDELQQTLLKDDCYIPGYKNTDTKDLLLEASVSASSFLSGCEPEMAISGVTRRVGNAQNCWESQGISEHGESLVFKLPSIKPVSQIRVTFDPNLTLEIAPSITRKVVERQVKGMPKELVKDYRLLIYNGEQLVYSQDFTDNYQRLNVHHLSQAMLGDRIEIKVFSTHGYPNARVFEVRAY